MKQKLAVVAIFLGSFLSFGIEPLVGRTLLPAFGGAATVWVVCLCAFQFLLLAGYFYAHRAPRPHVHIGLLTLAAAGTMLAGFFHKSIGNLCTTGVPAFDVLVCVALLIGFPFVLLSANSSMVQAAVGGEGVYRLYAVSNIGSLAGLLVYPFILEPFVSISHQWIGFSVGIAFYAVLMALLLVGRNSPNANRSESNAAEGLPVVVPWTQTVLWFCLPAFTCFFLNALTTHVTLDVMPMPLVWTGTLAIFLLSYVIGFSGKEKCLLPIFGWATIISLAGVVLIHDKPLAAVGVGVAFALYGLLLLCGCSFVHLWLYEVRPNNRLLTRYYLVQSLGGAFGGLAASIVFPLVAKSIVEYPIALVLLGGFVILRGAGGRRSVFAAKLLFCVAVIFLWFFARRPQVQEPIYQARGFFGTISVFEQAVRTARGHGVTHEYAHGTVTHGIQSFLPGERRKPTTYYTPNASGFGIVAHPKYRTGEPMRVNITGLGVGVLFCYGRTNDYYRAYEISKDALDVATSTNLFTFVSDCPAKKDIILCDARKGLEAELAAGVEPYDVIVLDAYSGDNLPYHLSTVEAFDLYFKLLKPDGILVVNITNWHLSLEPFMKSLGEHYDIPLLGMRSVCGPGSLAFPTSVALFCRQPEKLANPPFGKAPGQSIPIDFNRYRGVPTLPTDEKGSFISLIRW